MGKQIDEPGIKMKEEGNKLFVEITYGPGTRPAPKLNPKSGQMEQSTNLVLATSHGFAILPSGNKIGINVLKPGK
jgi:hypothetical protein